MDPRRRMKAASPRRKVAGLPAAMLCLALAASAEAAPHTGKAPVIAAGRPAIMAANRQARARSLAGGFKGGLQIFSYSPGAVYEIWTSPLRVTTLTLSRGENLTAISAGDTVRWQIAQTSSGEDGDLRAHVLIKPLEAGLETNLVLTTNRRVYLAQLRSGSAEAFNTAVAWEADALDARQPPLSPPPPPPPETPRPAPPPPLDARYQIRPIGRAPAWTPSAVMTDGARTFIVFPPALAAGPAPLLQALSATGGTELVNYRQQDGLYVVDQVLVSAELRQGSGRGQRVQLTYLGEAAR